MQVLNIFHVLVAIAMVAFILVQRGPGATAGAAFGSGASGTVFGARGAGSFLSRSTWVLGALFCLVSLVMAVVVSRDMSAPETDLGVVGSTAPTEQVEPAPPVPTLSDPESDVPTLDPALEAPSDTGGDRPSLDAAPEDTNAGQNDGGEDVRPSDPSGDDGGA